MLLDQLATQLVEVTAALVEGRTINIMNTDGIIVASSEPGRVGSFHQGALEAAQTGKMVNITREQLPRYSGAREGCNMPLRVNGSIIGVVGIRGNPPEIQALAHLLERYAVKYFQLEAMASPRLAESELRGRVLRALLAPSDSALANARALMDTLQIRLEFPLQVAVISGWEGPAQSRQQETLVDFFTANQWLRPRMDIWGTVDDRLVLLRSGTSQAGDMLRQLDAPGPEYKISFGVPCHSLWDIAASYEQASTLDIIGAQQVNDIQDPATRCSYMLYCTAVRDSGFVEGMYQTLQETFREGEWQMLLKTAERYYALGRSVTQAADALFIHKNTLQYRVHRLLEALNLDRCTAFQQEFLLRLLLEHHKGKQGLRALK